MMAPKGHFEKRSEINRLEEMAQKEEEVYIMEKILDKRISSKDGKLEYLIAWENFGPEDNTWEPQSNIFCPVMLKNFEKRRAAEKRLVYVLTDQF